MTILIVDDIPNSVSALNAELEKRNDHPHIVGFEGFEGKISELNPEIIIIDLMNGGPSSDKEGDAGNLVFDHVWTHKFCPIIIHSANTSLITIIEHNFIKKVDKGVGSEVKVLECVDYFTNYLKIFSQINKDVHRMELDTMKSISEYEYFESLPINLFEHIVRRHIAAFMDANYLDNKDLPVSSRYVVPNIGKHPLLGDILKSDTNGVYKLVLTPSCDLACGNGRTAKVDKVLVAVCNEICNDDVKPLGIKFDTVEDAKTLTAGSVNGRMPFPSLGTLIPNLIANMKNLELIPYDKNSGVIQNHSRIASLDSPFREQVSWAYIQNTGRPGIPECNYLQWAKDIAGKLGK